MQDHSHHQHAGSGFASLFDVDRFMPHGHCYQWDPAILWTSVISDSLIAAAYVAIPFTLVFQIMRKRKDLPLNWMFVCFGMFIVACGFTHIMEIITVWRPHYGAMAIVKAITAIASVPTAIILFRIAPKIVKLPTVDEVVEERSLRLRAEAASDAKDRFIAILSHELRTPLTPVKAGLDVLEGELRKGDPDGLSPSAQEALQMIRENVDMETVLINDLLDVSASGEGQLKLNLGPVDMRDVLRKSLAMLQDDIRRKNIDLSVRVEAAKTVVMGASIRLHQIISNLVTNALKFTPENGAISVALREANGRVLLSVADTGCGIAADALEKVFEPFEQVNRKPDNAHGGLGLGLTIAKKLAESHGGRLIAESDGTGRGAKFTLELPLADQQTPSAGEPSQPRAAAVDQTKPEILLVDDHADTLRTIAFSSAGRAIRSRPRNRFRKPNCSSTAAKCSLATSVCPMGMAGI
jgi:signal transduction histidine kinase